MTPGERVATGVLADIEAGRLRPGDQLPSEPYLQAAYGVGRAAVRSGLERLRRKGLIVTVQGSGSFVTDPKGCTPPMSATGRMLHDIREGIAKGTLKAGDQLPKEPELMATYKLSSPAIRAALRELRQEGLIHSRGRHGRFVGPEGTQVRREATKGEKLAEAIAAQIRDGRYMPGDCLPGEVALAEQFQMSRKVVRAAIALLQEQGLVVTVAAKGTFVKEREES
ncbi:regulatory protein, gntR family [Nonomuraea maritima]|uniref:Regulatory protein, gntR family n=2 Tax=Nonomuraea maritima TaxID=683260 RepID=A0A1G9MN34_9ACTN|nr:regulatory protein, gntR family [Nonomuraea maritima]